MPLAVLSDGVSKVEFSVVESENPTQSNEITDNPVESGENVSDHVKNNPISFTIQGTVVGTEAARKLSILSAFRKKGSILTYIGRNMISNLVIESLSTTHDAEVRNGFSFSLSLKQIRITVKRTVDIASPSISASQLAKSQNKGTQQTKKVEFDLKKEVELKEKAKAAAVTSGAQAARSRAG